MNNIFIPWPEWSVVKPLGQGGFGAVYQIERTGVTGSKEYSAMKIISIPRDESEITGMRDAGYSEAGIQKTLSDQKNRILKEYDFMAAMSGHPNIVQCFDRKIVQHANGYGWNIYIRMELLTPLTKIVRSGMLSETETIKLGKDICSALKACHAKDIIHRDIKPANILKSSYGTYKLGDFGIARTMDHTTQGTIVGTWSYIAPEVFKGEKYGKEVDIYSLGLVLYWLLNNKRLPFEPVSGDLTAEEAERAQNKRLKGERIPDPVRGSEALKRVVLKAAGFQAKDRYSSAEEMLQALGKAEEPSADGEYSFSYRKSSSGTQKQSDDGTYSIRFKKQHGSSDTGSVGWKDDDGSVGNEDHKRNTGGKADKTTPEYGTGPKTTETPKHPPEVKDPKIKISTEPSKKEDPKRVEQRKNARILALAIAVALVVLEIWTAKIDGTELDLEYIRNRILVAAIPFISCGILFYGKSFDLAFWASIVLGFFALYDVFVFAFYTMLSLNGEVSDLGMGIVIVIGIIIWIWAGKTVYWSIDEKNMKVK